MIFGAGGHRLLPKWETGNEIKRKPKMKEEGRRKRKREAPWGALAGLQPGSTGSTGSIGKGRPECSRAGRAHL